MKTVSTYVIALLVLGFLFIALPEKGNAGFPLVPGGPPCCDSEPGNICNGGADAESVCENFSACENGTGECVFFDNAICVQTGEFTGRCDVAPPTSKNVPTLGVLGLIVMAGVIGVIGFIAIRRRKVTA